MNFLADFKYKDRFISYLKSMSYNLQAVLDGWDTNPKFRKMIRSEYLSFIKSTILPNASNYIDEWYCEWIINKERYVEDKFLLSDNLDRQQKIQLFSPLQLKIFKNTLDSVTYHRYLNLKKRYSNMLYTPNVINKSSYEKLSAEKPIPLTKDEYYEYAKILLSSEHKENVFLGVMLVSGLRPSDILSSDIYVYKDRLYVEEIQKTKVKDVPIYTLIGSYTLMIYIKGLRENIDYKFVKSDIHKLSRTKSVLSRLNLERVYDIRALYSNAHYYYFKEELVSKYDFDSSELTKPAFINKILHHIEGSSTFMNYAGYVRS